MCEGGRVSALIVVSGARRMSVAPFSLNTWSDDVAQTTCDRILNSVARDERGQDLIEYALLVSLIAVVAVGAVTQVGQTINTVFWSVISASIP
jgi:Flp pilus assembly pilin Flp